MAKTNVKVDHVVLDDEGVETTAYRFEIDGITVWVDATPDGDTQRELVDKIILACNSHHDLLAALKELCELPDKKRPERVWHQAVAAIGKATP